MAIQIAQGFNVTSSEPIDKRLLLTKEEMRSTKLSRMPEKYLVVCKDDGKVYLWDSTNTEDPELGRFRFYRDKELSDKIDEALEEIAKLNEDLLNKQDKLVPGVNIKTINHQSILGSGNIDISTEIDPDELAKDLPAALRKALSDQQSKNSGLVVDDEGNIKVSLNEDHLQVIDNKIDLAISCIQAIESN